MVHYDDPPAVAELDDDGGYFRFTSEPQLAQFLAGAVDRILDPSSSLWNLTITVDGNPPQSPPSAISLAFVGAHTSAASIRAEVTGSRPDTRWRPYTERSAGWAADSVAYGEDSSPHPGIWWREWPESDAPALRELKRPLADQFLAALVPFTWPLHCFMIYL